MSGNNTTSSAAGTPQITEQDIQKQFEQTEKQAGIEDAFNKYRQHDNGKCPHCGYCPSCGRGGYNENIYRWPGYPYGQVVC